MTVSIIIVILLAQVCLVVMDTKQVIETTSTNNKSDAQSCEAIDLQKRSFTAPGRRVSEAKCYEYIWNIKKRMDKSNCIASHNNLEFMFNGKVGHAYIVGGRNTFEKEFPHMAAIGWKGVQDNWMFKCGGSLISPKFVLTAAHCTAASSRDTSIADVVPKIVRLGNKILHETILDTSNMNAISLIDKNIIKLIKHPLYKPPRKYYDIALLELENDVDFTVFAQPACLWSKPNDNSYTGQVLITGWGAIDEKGRRASPSLQAATIDMIDRATCNNLLRPLCNRNFCEMKDHQFCAGKLAGGVDSCQGDSGGPVQMEIDLPKKVVGKIYYVIGVTSFGKDCARANQPGIYTKVASFIDWIESIVWP